MPFHAALEQSLEGMLHVGTSCADCKRCLQLDRDLDGHSFYWTSMPSAESCYLLCESHSNCTGYMLFHNGWKEGGMCYLKDYSRGRMVLTVSDGHTSGIVERRLEPRDLHIAAAHAVHR